MVLGHKLAAGRGIEDGEEVLDIVAQHPATAHFIATKLVRRFVSDSRAAGARRSRGADVHAHRRRHPRDAAHDLHVARVLLAAAYRAKVKSPFELVVSALRAVGAQPDSTPRTAQMIAWLGEPIYGHQAPNGYPERGDAWINTGAILSAHQLRARAGSAVRGTTCRGAYGARRSGRGCGEGARARCSHDAQVRSASSRMLRRTRQSPDTTQGASNGGRAIASGENDSRCRRAHAVTARDNGGLALGSPEFQRR